MTVPVHTLRVGLFGIGLDTYWSQFEGLEEQLRGLKAGAGPLAKLPPDHPLAAIAGIREVSISFELALYKRAYRHFDIAQAGEGK